MQDESGGATSGGGAKSGSLAEFVCVVSTSFSNYFLSTCSRQAGFLCIFILVLNQHRKFDSFKSQQLMNQSSKGRLLSKLDQPKLLFYSFCLTKVIEENLWEVAQAPPPPPLPP